MRPAAPVTLGLAMCGAIGTALLADLPAAWNVATTWMVHTDAWHLLSDVLTLLALGAWLEPRIGSRRMAAWSVIGLGASTLAHAALYGDQRWLFGLSAMTWTIGAAGVVMLARDRAWWIGIAMVAALCVELGNAGRGVMTELGGALAERSRLVDGVTIGTVPLVHVACAGAGALAGLRARRCGPQRTSAVWSRSQCAPTVWSGGRAPGSTLVGRARCLDPEGIAVGIRRGRSETDRIRA